MGLIKKSSPTAGILPTTTVHGGRAARRRYPARQRCCSNQRLMTIICSVITILVLRGTIGISFLTSSPETRITSHETESDRIVAEIRSDGQDDDDSESKTVPNGTYTLGPKITDWDGSRRKWLRENPGFPKFVNGMPRILLITASQPGPCNKPIGDHYLLKSVKNKIDYCRMHDIEIVYNMAHMDPELSDHWSKLPLIRRLMLSHPENEWIWWMDGDAFFTNMHFEIPIAKYDYAYNLVVHGYPNLLFNEKSWTALNTGSFLIRNCQWSLELLDAWAQMGPKGEARKKAGEILTASLKGRPAFEADDQSALIYLLISRKNEWMDKVFLENSYYLHGFWVGLVDRYENLIKLNSQGKGEKPKPEPEPWPFVTHFVGCKTCGGHGDYSVERCVKSMEKAFNLADNQVLKMYGYGHRGLLSPNVKKIINDTDRPLEVREELNVKNSDLGR